MRVRRTVVDGGSTIMVNRRKIWEVIYSSEEKIDKAARSGAA